jgi:hypothetical protein
MTNQPPHHNLPYLAGKTINESLKSGNYIAAIENAHTILQWKEIFSNPDFASQVDAIINYYKPLAEKQRIKRIQEEQERLENELREAEEARANELAEPAAIPTSP